MDIIYSFIAVLAFANNPEVTLAPGAISATWEQRIEASFDTEERCESARYLFVDRTENIISSNPNVMGREWIATELTVYPCEAVSASL
jgi:hypothetical protein